MKLDANVSLGAVARAMNVALPAKATVKSVRVTVTYRVEGQDGIISSTRKGGDRLLVRNAEFRKDDAIDALSEEGWLLDDEEPGDRIDPSDVHDFIDACSAGDRCTALALVGRIFTGASAAMAEQLLLNARSAKGRQAA
ncbi:MAG: hypothetical protein CMO29_02030 [Tistrella sp.]|nr:hypothetical protein [Tistrella sp.]|tara:strand:+ start:530 stop:946 length:417 start_codon:yes stop_codon:yes gene_type:complete